ncbi:MAG: ABC-type transport auxiliary lipoprotein family protein [Nevskiaceae bacterium]|jgi:ABC-type uncharacterized transport system auxiliary subunit|nr:ABC-type transport auxiliary lipoprotein family protein [Nevskiaceae bacterium]
MKFKMMGAAIRRGAIGRGVIVAALLVPLAACGGLLRRSGVEQIYVLHPAEPAAAGAVTPTPGVLSVRRPEVQPGLETMRIALLRPGNRLDYFADSRWGASLPQVVDAFATQTLLSSNRFESVSDSERGGGAERFVLSLMVRHFEAAYSANEAAPPQVHVAFECLLLTGGAREPLGRCDGQATVPAAENRMESIVQAFEAAARQAMEQVVTKVAGLAANTR